MDSTLQAKYSIHSRPAESLQTDNQVQKARRNSLDRCIDKRTHGRESIELVVVPQISNTILDSESTEQGSKDSMTRLPSHVQHRAS